MEFFEEWLKQQLDQRNLGVREFARQANLSPGFVSNILNGLRDPAAEACTKIARALHVPEVLVFMKAGLMEETRDETELTLRELYEILKDLPMDAPNGSAIHLGYLGRELADQVATLIGQGAEMHAEVTAVTGGTFDKPTHGVNIAITYEIPEDKPDDRPRPDTQSTLKAVIIVLAIIAVLCLGCLIIAYLTQDPETAIHALETFPI